MGKPTDVTIDVVCDCGNQFTVPIAGQDLHRLEYECPACGNRARLTNEQVTSIMEGYEAVAQAAREAIGQALKRGK